MYTPPPTYRQSTIVVFVHDPLPYDTKHTAHDVPLHTPRVLHLLMCALSHVVPCHCTREYPLYTHNQEIPGFLVYFPLVHHHHVVVVQVPCSCARIVCVPICTHVFWQAMVPLFVFFHTFPQCVCIAHVLQVLLLFTMLRDPPHHHHTQQHVVLVLCGCP